MPLDLDERVWLGKYELLYRLGAGGMAELFLARTTAIHGFEKLVALKRVLAKHADNNQLIEMLLSEARLAASLHHPNIVQVYDVGEDQGDYFFTMEYVQGRDLRRLLRAANRRGVWIPIEHLINVMIHAAAGLHYAHERDAPDGTILGIVHRDISPSNIIVSFDGTVKVVDFGIAKAATSRESKQGRLMGKVPYMSPEQCRGEAVDRRSDIFSLGIILWELSLGRRLFNNLKGKPLLEYIGKTQAPRPSTFKPDYPKDLERIVMRALALDPSKRYATARALEVDLEEFARKRQLPISQARLAEFMSELFADEIRVEQARIQDYLAHNLPTQPPTTAAVQHTQPLPTISQDDALQALLPAHDGPGAASPTWHRVLPIVLVAVVLLLVVGSILDGETRPNSALRPSSGGGAWAEDSAIMDNRPTIAAEPREIVVPVVTQPPEPDSGSKASANQTQGKKPQRKKRAKKKVKLPDDWDPNSPLPPPR